MPNKIAYISFMVKLSEKDIKEFSKSIKHRIEDIIDLESHPEYELFNIKLITATDPNDMEEKL